MKAYKEFCINILLSYAVAVSTCLLIAAASYDFKGNEKSPVTTDYSIQYSDSFETKASYYEYPFHGRVTASGERYNMNDYTAAHKSLPFGTWLQVIDIESGKSVYVRVNDRGPFIVGRDIDLSKAAMENLGKIEKGVINVKVKIVK